jgi:hypothetical protein
MIRKVRPLRSSPWALPTGSPPQVFCKRNPYGVTVKVPELVVNAIRRARCSTERAQIVDRVVRLYIPACFKPKVKWVPQEQRGKVYCVPVRSEKVRVGILCGNIWTFQFGVRHNRSLANTHPYVAGQCLSFRLVDLVPRGAPKNWLVGRWRAIKPAQLKQFGPSRRPLCG